MYLHINGWMYFIPETATRAEVEAVIWTLTNLPTLRLA